MIFESDSHYFDHAMRMKHRKMLKRIFKADVTSGIVCKQSPGIYTHVKDALKNNLPIVGAALIVTVLCTRAPGEPLCICFACEDCFVESFLRKHMNSTSHVIRTLLYQNPWRLPFAYDDRKIMKDLKATAMEEEKERGRSERMLKVLDVPHELLTNLIGQWYPSVMDRLVLYHSVLKRSVPPLETYRKLDQNDRFPLLGMQFLVKYAVITGGQQRTGWRFMCLLCERKLTKEDHDIHVFSREHVTNFLKCFHPGSLSSHENKEILLDLAKQAARIHSIASVQEILLEKPISEPCAYGTLKKILSSAKQRNKNCKIPLEPPVTRGRKLVPRETMREVSKNHVMEGVTKEMSQGRPKNSTSASENQSVESVGSEPDKKAEVALETEEHTKATVVNQSEDTAEREHVTQCTETGVVANQQKNPRKRTNSRCEEPRDACLSESGGEGGDRKKQRLVSNEGPEEVSERLKQYFSRLEDCPAVGLNVLYECWCDDRDPIYLCECCSQTVKEEDIISHMTDSTHHKMQRLAVALDADVYYSLLSQNFITSRRMVRAHLAQEGGSELPSTSGVQPVAPPVTTPAWQHGVNTSTDCVEVVDLEIEDSAEEFFSATAPIPVMTNASAFTQVGPDYPLELGVQMAVRQALTVNKMDATPFSYFSATSSSIAEHFSSRGTVRSGLVTSSCAPTDMKRSGSAFKSPAATSRTAGDAITSSTVLSDAADTFTSAPYKPIGEISSSSVNNAHTKPSTNQLDAEAEAGPKEPSQSSGVRPCPIGINQLIKVVCDNKRQTYCRLCVVRLTHSSHTYGTQHRHKYVKLKNPGWTAKKAEFEEKLHEAVVKLAEDEKAAGSTSFEWIRVNLEEYKQLAALPVDKAVQRLIEMLKQKNSRNSPSTSDPGNDTRPSAVSASPSEFASPDCGMGSPPYETAGLSIDNLTKKGNACEPKTVPVQKAELIVESPPSTPYPLTSSVASVRPLIQTPDASEETPVRRKRQESDEPVLQDAQVSTAGSDETPSSTFVSCDAPVRPPTLSQEAEYGPRGSRSGPWHQEALRAQETIRMGEKDPGPSNLSKSLSVIVTEPFIGLSSIWECRGIAHKPLETIYLCECCQVKLFSSKIIKHMISTEHQISYMLTYPGYQKFMYWIGEDLTQDQREDLVRSIVGALRSRESSVDAQSVLLHLAAYKYVQLQPFRKALNLVRTIQRKDKMNMPFRPSAHLLSQNASVHAASPTSPVYAGCVDQGDGRNSQASLSRDPRTAATTTGRHASTCPK